MRTCPFHGCGVTIPDRLFACKKHWFTLNPDERSDIHQAFADYMDDKIDLDALRATQQRVLGDRGTAA